MTPTARLHSLGLWPGITIEAAKSATMASPSWWGADSERYSVRADTPDSLISAAAYVKIMDGHTHGYIDIEASFAAATAAGSALIGPRVFLADHENGVLVTEDFTGISNTATLDRFDSVSAAADLLALRRRVHTLPPFERAASVFDDIRDILVVNQALQVQLPADLDWMLRVLADAEGRIDAAGFDLVPAHGDGNVSNVLITEGDGYRLVDWDCAAMMDPLQDLGSALSELRSHDHDARELFEISWGTWDSSLFDRCRVYGIADCLRWGLIGAYADAARPGTLEYSKFSDWQFLRARAGLRDPHFDDRIRNL